MRRSSLYLALIVSSMSWPAAAEPVPLPKESPRDDALPAGAKLRLGGTRFRCSSRIQTVTFSPDGKILAGGGDDGLVVLWDRNTGHELRSWKCPCKYLHDLAFSPDGRFLASSSQMSKVFVWDPETGREVFNSGDNSYGYEFYAWLGARRIFLADWRSSTLQILEVPSGREERKWSLKTKYARFAASPDGKQIITLGTEGEFKKDSRLFFWDILANEPAKKFELPNPAGLPYGSIGHMVFSPDGQYFATTTDGGIVIWDAQTGKIAHHYPYPNRIFAFFLNNRFLLTSGGLSANILGVDSGKILRSCSTASNGISWGIISAAVTPDGQTLALATSTSSVQLWDVAEGKLLFTDAGHTGPVAALLFLKDSHRLVTFGADANICWDVGSGKVLDRVEVRFGAPSSVALAENGQSVRYGGASISSWQPGAQPPGTRTVHSTLSSQSGAMSPDGHFIAAVVGQGTSRQFKIQVYDIDKRHLVREIDAPGTYFMALATSSCARYVGCWGKRGEVPLTLWDTATGEKTRPVVNPSPQQLTVSQALFSPDARLLATANHENNNSNGGREIRIYEVSSGRPRAIILLDHDRTAEILAFTPDCRYFVYGLNSGELAIYDLSERKEPLTVPAHRGDVRSLAFSSDGARLASGGADSTSLIWDFSALVKHMKESKIGQHAQELLQDWNDLAADNGIRANAAIWRLAQSPDKALALLRDKFKPPQKPEPAQIEQWIRDLDHARFAVRESASKSLAEIGEEAREQLKQALKKGPAAEANRRITALLKSLGEPRVPRQLRPMRAVEVLEHIGSVEARQLLVEIGKQTTDGEVKREIDFTLERWLKK